MYNGATPAGIQQPPAAALVCLPPSHPVEHPCALPLQSFARQRNVQLLPQDETWALFNLLFGLTGLGKVGPALSMWVHPG